MIDSRRLADTLIALLRTPTNVPKGETEVLPGDRRITSAIDSVILPFVQRLQPDEVRRHPDGDVAARFGPDRDDGLLIQTYVVSQHANLMVDPLAVNVVDGVVSGQGAAQNKGAMAAALAALAVRPAVLARPVWLTLNTEGRSSHGGSARLLDDLGVSAAAGVVAVGTDLGVSLGNRGRVDVEVTIHGASCHSSQPWLGDNPIERIGEVLDVLRAAPLPEPHPELGPSSVTPYQVVCNPIAPHTIPSTARLTVDRRLLPGESPAHAVASLREHVLAAVRGVSVEEGVAMLPAVVDENGPLVAAVVEGLKRAGVTAATFWSRNTFDAGYACAKGIPTCMFGPGKRNFSAGVTRAESVSLEDCRIAAEVFHHVVVALSSQSGHGS